MDCSLQTLCEKLDPYPLLHLVFGCRCRVSNNMCQSISYRLLYHAWYIQWGHRHTKILTNILKNLDTWNCFTVMICIISTFITWLRDATTLKVSSSTTVAIRWSRKTRLSTENSPTSKSFVPKSLRLSKRLIFSSDSLAMPNRFLYLKSFYEQRIAVYDSVVWL